ncbi:MAG: TonB-dependent receptor [Akkermansiaceae bacterium]|nr:TonB-dependent receptor [Verrucomicrobiales bacterium]
MKLSGVLLNAALLLALVPTASGQGSKANTFELSNFSLEQLINIEITSVGKKETRLFRSPAAVAVLTQDDLRHLGATSIPEALRAIPGMQVARISGNRWAISSRGFNDEYANKLLVMVDGRSVYTPTFSGVYWNVQDVVLEDLDRIEVIRGPGATLWGANAVNGVINIITKSAKETQGVLVSSAYGTEDQPSASVRYGGQMATNVFYRVYAKYFNREGFEDSQGRGMDDDWNMGRAGFRVDWEASEQNTLTLSGDYFAGSFGEQIGKIAATTADYRVFGVQSPNSGGNLLGRWTSRFSEQSELKVQVYYDHYSRQHSVGGGVLVAEPNEFDAEQNRMGDQRDIWDVDMQHRFAWGERQDVVWGLGYRRSEDHLATHGTQVTWSSPRQQEDLFSAFLQDEITVVNDRLWLTLGSKFEHNDYTGLEIQPAARLLWAPAEHQTIWGSVARAVRTPARMERDARIDVGAVPGMPPVLVSAFGNPGAKSEELLAGEIGYRIEPTRQLSFDVTGIYNVYDLLAAVPGSAEPVFDPAPFHILQRYDYRNHIRGHTYGTELLARWHVAEGWRLTAGYTWLQTRFSEPPNIAFSHPENQLQVRSSLELGHGWELDTAAYFVDRLKSLPYGEPEPVTIGAYVRLDVGLTWKPNDRLEFSIWGQNLLDAGHAEFASYKSPNIAQIPRSFFGKVTLRF